MGRPCLDLLVVGGGAAGLAAARTALAAGLTVLVLEAKRRIGGRAHTDTATFGVPWDRGAHWLHQASRNPFTAFANALKLAAIVRERGVRIIHARSRAPAWSALLAARVTGARFVTTFHGIYNARSPLKRVYNSIMARGDAVIANSEYTRGHILSSYHAPADRIVVIPRGVDIDVFDRDKVAAGDVAAMRAGWGLAPDDARCVIIAPARLTRWKGHLVLIEAVRLIEARRPGALKAASADYDLLFNCSYMSAEPCAARHGV